MMNCPTCGQAVHAEEFHSSYDLSTISFDWQQRLVKHRGKYAQLNNTLLHLFEMLLDAPKKGITAAQIYDGLYGDRPYCDQPDVNIVCVLTSQLRKRITPIGICLESNRGRGARYYLMTRVPVTERERELCT
jgi:DNA-binding response OmpR family regulator